ncbi:DUF1653 domain-containing protein [Candidatus Woesearchaeota archaeon]|nr:DUF1653 domain-containing protein [Candidatus Woesearchaeota archaeon]
MSVIIYDPVYGKQEITDPLVLEIINTPEMQRLKGINQYGVWNLLDPKIFTSRFEHCLGVYFLLKRLGASREEEIAGLIHDISHTAFSHVIDYVFDDQVSQSVHERFYHQTIFNSDIPKILEKYNLDVHSIADVTHFKLLERDLPNLCADRIDYFLRDSLLMGLITLDEVNEIISHLMVRENELVFTDKEIALTFAYQFMEMGDKLWSPPIQSGSYQLMGDLLKEALGKRIITEDDFFSTDIELLEKLKASNDPWLIDQLNLMNYDSIKEGTLSDYTFKTITKARYVLPKIVVGDKIVSLIDDDLHTAVNNFKLKINQGYYIKIVNSPKSIDLVKQIKPIKLSNGIRSKEVTLGRYQHYKGNYYEVLHTGWHSDTHEDYVVYRGLYNSEELGKNPVFVRSVRDFIQNVIVDGEEVPRFKFLGEEALGEETLGEEGIEENSKTNLKVNLKEKFKENFEGLDWPRIRQSFSFLKEIEKLKYVERAIMLSGHERFENTAEHTWHMAMIVLVLRDLYPQADVERMLKMTLVHDLVEIYAGDTPLYDDAGRMNKKEREEEAARKLFSQLPSDLEAVFHQLFAEFEDQMTEESKIVRGCDELQAVMQNILSEGKTWKDKRLDHSWLLSRSRKKMGDDPIFQQLCDYLFQEIKDRNLAWNNREGR